MHPRGGDDEAVAGVAGAVDRGNARCLQCHGRADGDQPRSRAASRPAEPRGRVVAREVRAPLQVRLPDGQRRFPRRDRRHEEEVPLLRLGDGEERLVLHRLLGDEPDEGVRVEEKARHLGLMSLWRSSLAPLRLCRLRRDRLRKVDALANLELTLEGAIALEWKRPAGRGLANRRRRTLAVRR